MQTPALAPPQALIRLRGSVYPLEQIADAIANERGITCEAKSSPDGLVAFYCSGGAQSVEALRRLFLFEDYRVATFSQPDDLGSIVVIQEAPQRCPRRLWMPDEP